MKTPNFEAVLRTLPVESLGLVDAVLRRARKQRLRVYLVGGPVRDLLLGRPVKDVDLIVEPKVRQDAASLARGAAPSGAKVVTHGRFGTVTLSHNGVSLDLATLRSETYARPGALPSVATGSLEDDLRRRDFSVNALAIPLSAAARRAHPEIIDVADGRRDLKERRLRVLHERSFCDDPTRALRAARLGPRLGFSLERSSRSALRAALREGAFGGVSGDRLRREFEKLFIDAGRDLNPADALRRLDSWHVLAALEPGLELPKSAVAPLRRLGRLLLDPEWQVKKLRPWVAGLSLWLAPLAPGLRNRSLRRLAVRGETAARITGFPKARDRWFKDLAKARGRGGVDALLSPLVEEELHALWSAAEPRLRRPVTRFAAQDRGRSTPVDGRDLLKLGFAGAELGRALARVRVAFLDGNVQDREECLALARELVRKPARRRKQR